MSDYDLDITADDDLTDAVAFAGRCVERALSDLTNSGLHGAVDPARAELYAKRALAEINSARVALELLSDGD